MKWARDVVDIWLGVPTVLLIGWVVAIEIQEARARRRGSEVQRVLYLVDCNGAEDDEAAAQ